MNKKFIAITALATLLFTSTAFARDNVQIAGSSTVLPYASIVAELFGNNTEFLTPVVESGGSSAGLARFCEGIGPQTIDIANASRPMKNSEKEFCAQNGVTEILEVRIGYDGIVFAANQSLSKFNALTTAEVYLALSGNSESKTWADVNPSLPDVEILAYIPGTKHGTREVFEEKVMLAGCKEVQAYDSFLKMTNSEKEAEKLCMTVSKEKTVDIDGDYTETLARMSANPDSIGVFGLSFYENNTDKLRVATMNEVFPNTNTISKGEYPVSRPLFFYVKEAHLNVIPGLFEYVQFFMHEEIAGPNGPLANYGLVPDPEREATFNRISK